jgi:hypothetical protein
LPMPTAWLPWPGKTNATAICPAPVKGAKDTPIQAMSREPGRAGPKAAKVTKRQPHIDSLAPPNDAAPQRIVHELPSMGIYAPVTEDELARARTDPAFRQKLLSQNMEALLAGIKKLRKAPAANGPGDKQIREGVELAVRLAELIQGPNRPSR